MSRTGSMPRRLAVAVLGQFEALYSQAWGARARGSEPMWVNQRRVTTKNWHNVGVTTVWCSPRHDSGRAASRPERLELSTTRACATRARDVRALNPRTGFRQGTPYAVVGHWYESYAVGTGLGLTGSTSCRDRSRAERPAQIRTGPPVS